MTSGCIMRASRRPLPQNALLAITQARTSPTVMVQAVAMSETFTVIYRGKRSILFRKREAVFFHYGSALWPVDVLYEITGNALFFGCRHHSGCLVNGPVKLSRDDAVIYLRHVRNRQGDYSGRRVARLYVLEGLPAVLAVDKPGFHLLPHPGGPLCLPPANARGGV